MYTRGPSGCCSTRIRTTAARADVVAATHPRPVPSGRRDPLGAAAWLLAGSTGCRSRAGSLAGSLRRGIRAGIGRPDDRVEDLPCRSCSDAGKPPLGPGAQTGTRDDAQAATRRLDAHPLGREADVAV